MFIFKFVIGFLITLNTEEDEYYRPIMVFHGIVNQGFNKTTYTKILS